MEYKFPQITNINDVWPLVNDCDAFIKVDKGEYIVINYAYSDSETFPTVADNKRNAMRRECRGLIFDTVTGNLLSRSYHKFFNLGEKPETQAGVIDLDKPHVILEKLDGSMIRPVKLKDGIRWMSKMGITDVSMAAEVFVAKNKNYSDFAEACLSRNLTPIFEYVSPDFRIVLDYAKEDLILTAIRKNETGEYFKYGAMENNADAFQIPLANKQSYPKVEADTDIEGIVVRFDDGHMYKVKTEWYVKLHKTKDAISNERLLVTHILDNTVDDLLPMLPDKDREYVEHYQHYFHQCMKNWRDYVSHNLNNLRAMFGMDRKSFAIDNKLDFKAEFTKNLMFRGWDSGTLEYVEFERTIRKYLNKDSEFKRFKEMSRDWYNIPTPPPHCDSPNGPTR